MPSKKLLVPIHLSSGKKGQAIRGTKGFVEQGTDLSKQSKENVRNWKRWLRIEEKRRMFDKSLPDIPYYELERYDRIIERFRRERKEIAAKADFFIKQTNPRIKKIREKLIEAGIPIEIPIMDLKNGTELFERGNWRTIAESIRIPRVVPNRIIEIVKTMHSLGITHNHLHLANLLIDSEGNVKLIDLSRAKMYLRKPRNKKEFVDRYAEDIDTIAMVITGIKYPRDPNESSLGMSYVDLARNELGNILKAYNHPFDVTIEDIVDATTRNFFRPALKPISKKKPLKRTRK